MRQVVGVTFVSVLVFALAAGCSSTYKTKRVDPADDDEIMGTGMESADVLAIANLAEDLLALPQLTGPDIDGVPTVAIHPIENNTDVDFDTELMVRTIRQKALELAKGRVVFVTRDSLELAVIEKERAKKREGEYTSSKQEVKTGADYVLSGTAAGISKVGEGLESRTLFLDFNLTDAENGTILWEKRYLTKKIGKQGVLYR